MLIAHCHIPRTPQRTLNSRNNEPLRTLDYSAITEFLSSILCGKREHMQIKKGEEMYPAPCVRMGILKKGGGYATPQAPLSLRPHPHALAFLDEMNKM